MKKPKPNPNGFFDDDEKMRDFLSMSRENFLAFYEYLTDEEYDATERAFKNDLLKEGKIC